MEPLPPCILCLKGVKVVTSRSKSTHDLVLTLCGLLTPPGAEPFSIHQYAELEALSRDGKDSSICNSCSELIKEMTSIRGHILQLETQFEKRMTLIRNRILPGSGVNNTSVEHYNIRQMLLELWGSSGQYHDPDNLDPLGDVQVKVEDCNEDDEFLDEDPLDQSPPQSLVSNLDEEDITKTSRDLDQHPSSLSSLGIIIRPLKNNSNLRSSSTRKRKAESGKEILSKKTKTTPPPSVNDSKIESTRRNPKRKCTPQKKKKKLLEWSPEYEMDSPEMSSVSSASEFDPDEEFSYPEHTKKFPTPTKKCGHCSMTFGHDQNLSAHIEEKHPIQCSYCDERFPTQTKLVLHHKSTHSAIPLIQFRCPICRKRFRTKKSLEEHIFIRHETEEKAFACPKCGKGFSLELNYTRHLTLHSVEKRKPLVCEVCDGRFPDKPRLDRHLESHKKKSYPCGECPLVCANLDGLKRHRRFHTGEKPFKCDHCEERFRDLCGKGYHNAKMHSGRLLCSVCGLGIIGLSQLRRHLARHEGKLTVPCDHPLCQEGFKDKEAMQSHKIEKHGADPLVCEECGAKYMSKGGLKLHKMTVHHVGEKPHKCQNCDARFFTGTALAQHMTSHSQDRPHSCPHCEAKFKAKKNLSRHLRTNHATSASVPYECPLSGCGLKFESKLGVQKHQQKAHDKEKASKQAPPDLQK